MTVRRRIAWLSPYGTRSDIGAFTRCLLPHFARPEPHAFDCDLFINANGTSYDSPVPAMEIPQGGAIGEILSRYDAAIFNLGNNVQNHAQIAAALRQVPGIAVLHDFSYHHYFAHLSFDQLKSPASYARLMHDYYGSAGFNVALRSGVITREPTLYSPWDGENVADSPLMRPLAMLASAIVVHSRFMEERVARFFKGPILRLFLPSDQKVAPTPQELARWQAQSVGKERCQFATFGHIGRPKCLDVIIQALGQSPTLRAHANLVIAGHPGDKEYVREIEAMVTRLALTKQVTFEYGVTNERLLEIKNQSDVFVNLRYPNTEGASGSLIEMLNAARPVIAYRSGCYAEIPDQAAVLIDRDAGLGGVIRAMESLALEPARRFEIGTAAREYVREQDSAKYVRDMKAFIESVRNDLRRRAHFVAPVRDAMAWRRKDVLSSDSAWFDDLTHARRSLIMLERDGKGLSPEIFLTWPMDDLIAFIARVLLHASARDGLVSHLVDYAQRLGRWHFYRLVVRVFHRQTLCQQSEISTENIAAFGDRVTDAAFWDLAARLHPEIYVRLLYFCLLGRAWGPGEPDNWVKRIRQGVHPAAILQEFVSSVEYRQTFADDAMKEVEAWAKQETALSSKRKSQPRAKGVWPAQDVLHFNEDLPATEALLGQLWHRRDAQGRWSDGRVGDLNFHLPEGAAELGATLTLRLRVAGTRVTGQRQITAHGNRQELASIAVRDDAPFSWHISIPPASSSKNGMNLLLMVDQDFSPSAGGQSRDKRSLGIMLIEGQLTLGAADSAKIAADTPADTAEKV
jgi:glycosyltransferase involved in cell wall biosynthesis